MNMMRTMRALSVGVGVPRVSGIASLPSVTSLTSSLSRFSQLSHHAAPSQAVTNSVVAARASAPHRLVSSRASLNFTSSSPFVQSSSSHADFSAVRHQQPTADIEEAKKVISKDISSNKVFLYMKGSPQQPQCGFSRNVVNILNAYAPELRFQSRDVLEDENIRAAIKQVSDWPTLPQLFVDGEFVGGSDIVGNMYKSGELDKVLGVKQKEIPKKK